MINASLQKIQGFEATDYAYSNGRIVWTGKEATSFHPRHFFSPGSVQISPISPISPNFQLPLRTSDLIAGAHICMSLLHHSHASQAMHAHNIYSKSLLLWLKNQEMPFPMNLSAQRFDNIKSALVHNDIHAFTLAAQRVIGLGNGLTPSGDDFVGGIFFALAHSPRPSWNKDLASLKQRIRATALQSTNVISAALLDDLIDGQSFSVLHDVLLDLQSHDKTRMKTSCDALLTIGASSGADMLAGLLLGLSTHPELTTNTTSDTQH